MVLAHIEITDFRNISSIVCDFSEKVNFVFGDNAQGKTNLIEAIYHLCLARSFKTRDDAELLRFGANEFILEGRFVDDIGIVKRVGVSFSPSQGKRVKVDGKRLGQLSHLVGQFPAVVLSSSDLILTSGPPAERRRFFNILVSQSSAEALGELREYERTLKQRNKILAQRSAGRDVRAEEMEVWDRQLVRSGEAVIKSRDRMVRDINAELDGIHHRISGAEESLRIRYRPNVPLPAEGSIAELFLTELQRSRHQERKLSTTVVGPHRDDFTFLLGDRDLRRYGSRGEHKTALISVKAAEARVLFRRTEIIPILLLDDLYAELDAMRSTRLLSAFGERGQTFITGTSLDFQSTSGLSGQPVYFISAGRINKG